MDNSPWIPSLPELLKECLARAGWNQVAFAERLGKDPSEVSKILSGKTSRPQSETLELMARIFQQAGLDIKYEQLMAARDVGHGGYPNVWKFPDHWLRLLIRIMGEDDDIRDFFYHRWAHDYEQITALLSRRK